MKIIDAFQPFMDFSQAERMNAPETQKQYSDVFTSWLIPVLGFKEIDQITPLDVLHLRKKMADQNLSVSRIYSVIVVLKIFLKFCRATLKQQTLEPSLIKLPRRGDPNVVFLDNEECTRVLEAINIRTFSGLRLRALVELILGTGLRISEALSLDRRPFDLEQKEIEVIGKGKKRRMVFLTDRIHFWVRQFLSRRWDRNQALFVTTGDDPQRLAREDISRFFIRLRKDAGITKKLTPHILRHTFCTNMRNNGADITLIKELAGHQDIETTARYYLGFNKKILREAVYKYGDFGLSDPGRNH